ncbi:MAG: HD domain-containing protein [Chloroflexota bacterium]
MMVSVEADLKLSLNPTTLSLLSRVEDFLSRHDTRAYVVGGFLRDFIIKRSTADIDIALEADALHIAPQIADHLGGKFVALDEMNGVGRVILSEPGEHPDSRQWQIDFSTIEDGIAQDLARRDFTIDAMAISLDKIVKGTATSEIIDPFNGLEDIERRVIKATGDTIFREDAARLLRAVRLAAELNFIISPETETLIRQNCHLITTVAGERVREELLKLLVNTDSSQLMLYLDDLGLLTALIPELAETKGVEQPTEHQWNVFNHSVKVIDAADFILRKGNWEYTGREVLDYINWSAELAEHFELKVSGGSNRRLLLKLAALLHDIAKPQTKMINAQGRTRFHGHPQQGAPIAAAILERLRFSTKEVKLVAAIVRHHLRPVQTSHGELPTGRAIYRYFRDTDDAAIDVLFFSLADHLATRGANLDIANWQQHTSLVNYMLDQHSTQRGEVTSPKLISGHDLIRNFNLKPGPEIGRVLEAVREAHACREITSRDEALAYADHLLSSKRGD